MKLAEDQKLWISKIQSKWMNIASRPISDRIQTEQAIADLYKHNRQAIPEIVWARSPKEAIDLWLSLEDSKKSSSKESLWNSLWCLQMSLMKRIDGSHRAFLVNLLEYPLRDSLWGSLRNVLLEDLLEDLLGEFFEELLTDSLRSHALYGAAAVFEMANRLGVNFNRAEYDLLLNCAKSFDFIVPFEDICVVVDRPEVCWNDSKAIAAKYLDGFKVYVKK